MSALPKLPEPSLKPCPETLDLLRGRFKAGCLWAAYQVREKGHAGAGELQYLLVGEGCVFKAPPFYCPDIDAVRRWPFQFIGWANMVTGKIDEEPFPEWEAR